MIILCTCNIPTGQDGEGFDSLQLFLKHTAKLMLDIHTEMTKLCAKAVSFGHLARWANAIVMSTSSSDQSTC